ncbi:MAG: hypothetical protein ACKVZJ_02930 [Phycisphaerales bacterium]
MNPFKKLTKPAAAAVPVSVPASAPAAAAPAPKANSAAKPSSGLEGKPSAGPTVPSITISNEAIAQAAYFRWLRCGGDEDTNWRLAEAELREEAARVGLKA